MLLPAAQPGDSLDQHGAAPHLQAFRHDIDINVFTDQSTRHRVDVREDADRAPLGHSHPTPMPGVDAPRGEIAQVGSFGSEPFGTAAVSPDEELAEELLIGRSVVEVAAAAQHQGLSDRLFESVMALFGISVLVRLTGVDGLSSQAIVGQQGAVALLEEIAVAEVVHRGGEPIGAVHLGNPSQFPEGVLEPLAEALETLGETDRSRLPVGEGQDEVIDHVIKRLTGQRDPQIVHVSEVGGAELAGRVDLIEEDLLGRTRDGLPRLDLPLQGAELAVGKPTGESALEILEKSLGLEAGMAFQQVLEFGPNVLERILPGLPGSWGQGFTGQAIRLSVLSSGLGVHVHPPSRTVERHSPAEKLAKLDNLAVRFHGGLLLTQEETAE
jgi:hypothetical protein